MKNSIVRSLSLLGISLMMTLSVAAQDVPKEKITDKEDKYKSEDLKTKDKKDKKDKYKTADLKIKDKKDESKVKEEAMKIKEDGNERKIKGRVRPMAASRSEQSELRTGEEHVTTTEHFDPLITDEPVVSEPSVAPVVVPEVTAPVKKTYAHKYTHRKSTPVKYAANSSNRPRYIVRTKVVRDTVFVPGEPVVTTQTQYIHDTVSVTRVDTFIKAEKENTYTGYRVPNGDFKKVKLKKDNDGDVWMKRKE